MKYIRIPLFHEVLHQTGRPAGRRRQVLRGCLCVLLAGLLFQPVQAQEDGVTWRDTLQADQVVVTGTRRPVLRDRLSTPVSVVDRETLSQHGTTALLSVLSEEVPGMFVTQRGMMGYGSSTYAAGGISLRGMSGSAGQVLMLIDGHPQYAGIFGHPVADAYVTGDAERVEVFRGASSVLYGSNAMGGAVNIITRRATHDGNRLSADLSAGSYGTQQYQVSDSWQKGRLQLFGNGGYSHTDGHRPRSAFDAFNLMGKAGYRFSEAWRLTASVNLSKFNAENPGMESNPLLDGYADVVRGMSTLSADHLHGRFSGALHTFFNWGNHHVNDGYQAGGTPQPYVFHSTDFMGGANLYETFRYAASGTVTAGMDLTLYGGNAFRNPVTEIYADHESLSDVAGYVFLQQDIRRFSLLAGLRLGHHELYGNIWIPQAGVSYALHSTLQLKCSASKGYRTPSMKELYMYVSANEALLPEENWNYDVTVSKQLLDGRAQMECSLFYTDGDNMVEVVREQGRPQNRNVGSFIHKGLEYSVRYDLSAHWKLRGNCSLLHMDKPVAGAPRRQGYVRLQYTRDTWNASASWQQVSGLYLTTGDAPESESYGLLSLRAGWTACKGMRFFAEGGNLLARRYATMAGFPMPGRTFMAGVSLER